MSIDLLEQAVDALGELTNEVVFVGAATLSLWITDPGAPTPRPTADVDVVVEVTTLIEYNRFEASLRSAGFRDDGQVLGRFVFIENGLLVDAIPADASILGFQNRWQRASLATAISRELPSGTTLRAIGPANLLATKLEAFAGRGEGNFIASPDFEDVVNLIDGRSEIVGEVLGSDEILREYVAAELSRHLADPRGREAIAAHVGFDESARVRADSLTIPAFERLATRTNDAST